MNLLENDITQIIINNYDLSVGHVNTNDLNIKSINDGIITTKAIRPDDIKYCSEIKDWVINSTYAENTFWKVDNKIYVCLYAPLTESFVQPVGNTLFNQLLDDNYVWRYVADVDYVVYNNYVQYKQNYVDVVKKGCIQNITITHKSDHLVSDFTALVLQSQYTKGQGATFTVENDQITQVATDILIQNGGSNYTFDDLFVITDKVQNPLEMATINIFVDAGEVKLDSFTNGENYENIEIIILGDGVGATVNYSLFAGVLTNVSVVGGSGYTWAKVVILNSDKYIIGNITLEPLNGFNADLKRHIGANKYVITSSFEGLKKEINFYGIHRKTPDDRYKHMDNMYLIDEFMPEPNEIIKLKIVLG